MTTKELAEILTSRKVALLVGAGISFQSGIPLVAMIVPTILQAIGVQQEDLAEYVRIGLPFEATMQTISELVGFGTLLEIFKGDAPQRNHLLIARLAATGHVSAILTTNFDRLIERAFEEIEVPLDVFIDGYSPTLKGNRGARLLKLHGCLSQPQQLGATIKAVARQRAVQDRYESLLQILRDGAVDNLVVLGYSFSDRFDISPALIQLKLPIQVTIIDHSPTDSGEVQPLSALPEWHPLRDHLGVVIRRHTDRMVEDLWRVTQADEPPRVLYPPTGLSEHMSAWSSEVVDRVGAGSLPVLAAALFKGANAYQRSNYYGQQALSAIKDDDYGLGLRTMAHQILGDNFRDLGAGRNALNHLRAALRCADDMKSVGGKAKAINSIGVVLEDRAKKDDLRQELDTPRASRQLALNCYRLGQEWAEEVEDVEQAAKCEGNVGIALKNVVSVTSRREAFRHLRRALAVSRDLGDPRSEARYYGMLASCVSLLGKKSVAKGLWEKALKVSRDIQDHRHIAIWTTNAGEDLIGIDNVLARDRITEAVEIFERLGCAREVDYCVNLLAKIPE